MPELPEVETLRRDLAEVIIGKTIATAEIDWPKMVKPLTSQEFIKKIKDQKIVGVERRAKVLILKLKNGQHLLFHLKMTGQLIFRPQRGHLVVGGHPQKGSLDHLPNKFSHIIFSFKDGAKLFFNDMRKFGWARVADKIEIEKLSKSYGVEPLSREFTLKKFKEILKSYPKRKIKQLLFDQALISGLGNIYVDESCYYAKIRPMRTAQSLKNKEITDLYQAIKKVLNLSITKRGTSFNTYVHLNGNTGGFVPYLKVYGRAGKKCRRCSGTVKKIKLNGRGTQFCEQCQK